MEMEIKCKTTGTSVRRVTENRSHLASSAPAGLLLSRKPVTCACITPHMRSLHFICVIDGLRWWFLHKPAVSTQRGGGGAVNCNPSARGKNISLQELLAHRLQIENSEGGVFSFSIFILLAAELHHSSERQRKPKLWPHRQTQSHSLCWLFAVLGCSPVYTHPLLCRCSFWLGLIFIGSEKQHLHLKKTNKEALNGLDVPLVHHLFRLECIF